jgi:acyl-CoA thioester hydrolase
MRHDPARLELGNYPFNVELQTRFGDMDPNYHINNVSIMRLFEESRLRFGMYSRSADLQQLAQQVRVVVADLRFSFLREVFYPDPVIIGVGIKHVGNTSYQIGCAMFQRGQCVALSDAVVVCSDGSRSQPVPDFVREALLRQPITGLQPA